jgi:hypothetical protein
MTSLGQTAASVRSRGAAATGATAATLAPSSGDYDEAEYSSRRLAPLPGRASSLPYTGKLNHADHSSKFGVGAAGSGTSSAGAKMVEWRLLAVIVAIAFVVRMYKIGQPSSVV